MILPFFQRTCLPGFPKLTADRSCKCTHSQLLECAMRAAAAAIPPEQQQPACTALREAAARAGSGRGRRSRSSCNHTSAVLMTRSLGHSRERGHRRTRRLQAALKRSLPSLQQSCDPWKMTYTRIDLLSRGPIPRWQSKIQCMEHADQLRSDFHSLERPSAAQPPCCSIARCRGASRA